PATGARQARSPDASGEGSPRPAGGNRRDARGAGRDAGGDQGPEGDPGVREPGARYSAREQVDLFGDDQPQGRLGHETDLLGQPLQADPGRLAPARPESARVPRDAQPAATVPGDTPAPAGKYRVR